VREPLRHGVAAPAAEAGWTQRGRRELFMSETSGKYRFGAVGFFFMLHAGAAAALLVPFDASLVWWLAGSYALRMFGVTAGYHRYFSHRSYKLGRAARFAMAFLAQTSAQKGVLWWAAHHRTHHRHSEGEKDVHSPVRSGFWWSHVGWVISNRYDRFEPRSVGDLYCFAELRWLDRNHWVPTVAYAATVWSLGGLPALVWGYVLSTVLLYHGTFSINSLAHVWGTKRFRTGDESRNNFVLALLTLGEGWHNNHHYYQSSCRQGVRWWEVDLTFYLLRSLELLGVTRDLRPFRKPTAGGGYAR
jgi:stearoyl-CoA desaturase (Delta-9 desaturase)